MQNKLPCHQAGRYVPNVIRRKSKDNSDASTACSNVCVRDSELVGGKS